VLNRLIHDIKTLPIEVPEPALEKIESFLLSEGFLELDSNEKDRLCSFFWGSFA